MPTDTDHRLFELADRVLAIGRHLRALQESETQTCTTVESAVIRHITQNPGASPHEIAKATVLHSSNVARTLRALEEKGMVYREKHESDARRTRLFPTERAGQDLEDLHGVWRTALADIIEEPEVLDTLTSSLARLEDGVAARRAARADR